MKVKRSIHQQLTCVLCIYLILFPLPLLAGTTDAAKVAPENALIYIGWAGRAHTRVAARDTAMGKTLADPQVRRFVNDIFQIVNDILINEMESADDRAAFDTAKRILATLYEHPSAFFVMDAGLTPVGPAAEAALICLAGKKSEQVAEDVAKLLAFAQLPPAMDVDIGGFTMKQLPLPLPGGVYYGVMLDTFVLVIGRATAERLAETISDKSKTLARSESFMNARAVIGGHESTRSLSVFIDVDGVRQRLVSALPALTHNDPSANSAVQSILAMSGLNNIRTLFWEIHHKSNGIYSSAFLQSKQPIPNPNGGICKPLTEIELGMLPRDVHWAVASRIDVAKQFSWLVRLIGAADDTAEGGIRDFLSKADERLGFSIEHDLIDHIGDTVLAYDATGDGGMFFTGVNVLVKVKDSKEFSTRFLRLMKVLGEVVTEEAGDGVSVLLQSEKYKGHTIHYASVVGAPIPIAPAWVSHNEWMAFALFPQMIRNAIDRLVDGTPASDSMLSNPDFKAYKNRIGDMGYSFSYANTPEGVQDLYSLALPMVQTVVSGLQAMGVSFDPASFPSQHAISQHLFADLSTTRCEPDGLLHVSHGPLPIPFFGTDVSSSPFVMAALISILLPSLSRARELSKRLVSASNLKGIGTMCFIYANDHNGQFPPDFETIFADESMDPALRHAPNHEPGKPCYLYISGQISDSPADNVLAYERPGLNGEEGVNVLFLDGHVQFIKLPELQSALQKTKQRLSRSK